MDMTQQMKQTRKPLSSVRPVPRRLRVRWWERRQTQDQEFHWQTVVLVSFVKSGQAIVTANENTALFVCSCDSLLENPCYCTRPVYFCFYDGNSYLFPLETTFIKTVCKSKTISRETLKYLLILISAFSVQLSNCSQHQDIFFIAWAITCKMLQ